MEVIVYDGMPLIGRNDHSTILRGKFRSEIVAVKRAKDIEGSRRNLIEAEQLGKLRHDNVVKFFESGVNRSGTVDIVLELAHGAALAEALKNVRLTCTEEWKRSTIHQIAEGLAYIHREGIQHRDLKPKNILFKDHFRERVLIADFGMATSEEVAATAGARVFQCPEDAGAFTTSNDVYCLAQIACCIVEMENPRGRRRLHIIRNRALCGDILGRNVAWLNVVLRTLHGSRYSRASAAEFRDAFRSASGIGDLDLDLSSLVVR